MYQIGVLDHAPSFISLARLVFSPITWFTLLIWVSSSAKKASPKTSAKMTKEISLALNAQTPQNVLGESSKSSDDKTVG